jgi:hypothetical protein
MWRTILKVVGCIFILLFAVLVESRLTELEAHVMVLEIQMQYLNKTTNRFNTISY